MEYLLTLMKRSKVGHNITDKIILYLLHNSV